MQTSSSIQHPLVDGCPPSWASGWGQDEFGIFAEFSVLAQDGSWVTQRMRWIPAGTFLMGSPDDEPGRYGDEGPQHVVSISQPLWIFDTPCTQALWQAVMRKNPSRFIDPERPVDSVSWHHAHDFMNRLISAVPDLSLRLPSEAEWEYACRAGTTEATYAGPIEILGNRNAPILDAIAWYGGNCGVDFDLDEGEESFNWLDKQHHHERAGTRKVALRQPNRWGLYDMLGNVWEWCQDYWGGKFSATAQIDPQGPLEGHVRVLRGGCWYSHAQSARSACRDHYAPNHRLDEFGFRCVHVQGGSGKQQTGDRVKRA